jgi:hypothetical protein
MNENMMKDVQRARPLFGEEIDKNAVQAYIDKVSMRAEAMGLRFDPEEQAAIERLKYMSPTRLITKLARNMGLGNGYGKAYVFAIIDAALDLREKNGTLPNIDQLTEAVRARSPEKNRTAILPQEVKAVLSTGQGFGWPDTFKNKLIVPIPQVVLQARAVASSKKTLKYD